VTHRGTYELAKHPRDKQSAHFPWGHPWLFWWQLFVTGVLEGKLISQSLRCIYRGEDVFKVHIEFICHRAHHYVTMHSVSIGFLELLPWKPQLEKVGCFIFSHSPSCIQLYLLTFSIFCVSLMKIVGYYQRLFYFELQKFSCRFIYFFTITEVLHLQYKIGFSTLRRVT
jgi:hypothetical protein